MIVQTTLNPTNKPKPSGSRSTRDPNTLSNYNAWRTKHTTASLNIDFTRSQLKGTVELTLERLGEEKNVVLDTSFLDITSVHVGGQKTSFHLPSSRTEPYGTPLTIAVDPSLTDTEIKVSIEVQTTEKCTALQWLQPAQTSNKKHPYMFSQCQAIHARSILPCQDTPDVKSTYTFQIRSPLPVLASGLPAGASDFVPGEKDEPGTLLYTFQQDIPIPSYLFAVASGDIACASIGPRSTVWTGPEELLACQWEFEADTEKYIRTAEKLVYPYAWTTYNVLVLPPSFPYGGMENPIYTFATPTVVSGDRQNIDVIAHELSHSWSGNLVSNASWEHFWLNEGWTTYLERRIQAAVHGDDDRYRDFSAIIGWKALEDSVARFGPDHEFTKLVPDLAGRDPDEAFSSVPYEKGFVLLHHLEKLLGRAKWDSFTRHYFAAFRHRSLDTSQFHASLIAFFAADPAASDLLAATDWNTWFHAPGLPPRPHYDSSLADHCHALAARWQHLADSPDDTFRPSPSDIAAFTSTQCAHFLDTLQQHARPLPPRLITQMDAAYGLAARADAEVASRFLVLALRARAPAFYPHAATLLARVGRMKFVRPVFRELLRADPARARAVAAANRKFWHPICVAMVQRMLEGEGEAAEAA